MRTFDLSPLFRSTVGFDRVSRLLEAALTENASVSYPPYNIEKTGEHNYRITMAVAGFAEEDIEITSDDTILKVSGKVKDQAEGASFLYRGIAGRTFERRFQLADHIRVTGAEMAKGMLHVDLVREVPEEKKPRRIAIGSSESGNGETKAA